MFSVNELIYTNENNNLLSGESGPVCHWKRKIHMYVQSFPLINFDKECMLEIWLIMIVIEYMYHIYVHQISDFKRNI